MRASENRCPTGCPNHSDFSNCSDPPENKRGDEFREALYRSPRSPVHPGAPSAAQFVAIASAPHAQRISPSASRWRGTMTPVWVAGAISSDLTASHRSAGQGIGSGLDGIGKGDVRWSRSGATPSKSPPS